VRAKDQKFKKYVEENQPAASGGQKLFIKKSPIPPDEGKKGDSQKKPNHFSK